MCVCVLMNVCVCVCVCVFVFVIGSKHKFVSDYGPLTETFLQDYMDDTEDKTCSVQYESGKFMIGDQLIKIQGDNIEMYMGTPSM